MMTNPYAVELQKLKDAKKHIPKQIKDQWRTPDWLFYALNSLYGPFLVDLFSDGQNAKCSRYFMAEDNALQQNWKEALEDAKFEFLIDADCAGYDATDDLKTAKCFANPPYSPAKYIGKGRKNRIPLCGMRNIMAKAYEEHKAGCPSFWLLKSATSEDWWPNETASQIIHIKGRIAFEKPVWFRDEVVDRVESSAAFGASVAIFNGVNDIQEPEAYISRDTLKLIGEPLAEINAERRAEWIASFDDL
ncbi:putative DNA methyltransferase [Proteus phage vB_PmiS_DoubleBarrel]|nr:putative DNA methyltransferase [Proteus phage vB_PmiS_DoubleBarrel]